MGMSSASRNSMSEGLGLGNLAMPRPRPRYTGALVPQPSYPAPFWSRWAETLVHKFEALPKPLPSIADSDPQPA
jgi:hypothetical protein